jgi:catalase
VAAGGELHQAAGGEHPALTTNQGAGVSDNQNSLRANPHGPTLLEDFVLREKIMHSITSAFPSASCTRAALASTASSS